MPLPFYRMLCLIIGVLFLSIPAMASEELKMPEPTSKPIRVRGVVSIYMGLAPLLIDTDQFNSDLDTLGLEGFDIPVGARLGIATDIIWDRHSMRYGIFFRTLGLESHKGGRISKLDLSHTTLDLEYDYRITRWVSFHTGPGFGISNWEYTLISPDFNGQCRGTYYPFQPVAGFQFYATKYTAFNVYGSYHLRMGKGEELYSGDMERAKYDDFDFSHASFGLDYVIRLDPN